MALSDREIAIAKGMILRGDRQHDIAAYFGENGGRIGEISTGKSALINALVGRDVAAVDVQGGWTKEIWKVNWEGSG